MFSHKLCGASRTLNTVLARIQPVAGSGTIGRMASRVLIVDDHTEFRESARRLLDASGYEVVGVALDAEDALVKVDEFEPDLVMLDVQMDDIDGFVVCEEICQRPCQPAVVMVSMRPAATYGTRVAESSACGFIHKPDLSGETLAAALSNE